MTLETALASWSSVTSAVTRALTPGQLFSLVVVFLGVVGLVVGAAYWISAPTYGVLFSDMDPESAATVVDDLRAREVPFQLAPGGRSVRVPADQLDELRLQFASDGQLPASGRIGFEIFDRTAFGATEFLEQVNFRRALEGEIARTIGTLSVVASARVHIARAQQPLFGARDQPAKASVVLTLRNTRLLRAETANGIVSLVSASVEGLQPDAVVLVDSFGRSLSTPFSGDEAASGPHTERRQQLEHDLTTRVVQLLEPVVGMGRVRANVAVNFISASAEETQEVWDPHRAVVRSRHLTGDSGPPPTPAGGLSGARSNLPPPVSDSDGEDGAADSGENDGPPLASPTTRGTGVQRRAETTNYEISKSVSRTVRPGGDIARLSVAVILDDQLVALTDDGPRGDAERTTGGDADPADAVGDVADDADPADAVGDVADDADPADAEADVADASTMQTAPWSPEDLEKIHGLVAAAVGLDPTRGDQLTVENITFEDTFDGMPVVLPFWQRFGPQLIEALRIIGVVALVALGMQIGVRPLILRVTTLRSAAGSVSGALPEQLPSQDDELRRRIEAELRAGEVTNPRGALKLDALSNRVTALSQQEPQNAARLLRAWLDDDTR